MMIHIGGQCGIVSVMRDLFNETYTKSLPFDYLRTTLKCIIKNINNNFIDFIPSKNKCDFIYSYRKQLFISNDSEHAFYNHDITLNDIKESFKRRSERFIDILTENNSLIIFRVITSKYISDEINLKDQLYHTLKKINSNMEIKIIFIGHRNDKDNSTINYNYIDDNTFLFTCGTNDLWQDYCQIFYKNCINFILKNGLLKHNLVIKSESLDYIINDDYVSNDINSYYLDDYYDFPEKILKRELIINEDEFNNLYPTFNIDLFKNKYKEFEFLSINEIKNYFHLYYKDHYDYS